MPVKRTPKQPKSQRVFGHARKQPKMLRAGLYARVSTLDQQTLPLQTRAVRQATEAMAIEPNSVYVIPPNSNITISGRVIRLAPRILHSLNLPIDCFLEALANEQGTKSIGVVLSGNGADGSEGLKAIKSQGGITFVQTESSAKFGAITTGAPTWKTASLS